MPLTHLFDVLIIGGGYSGAALAVRLSREARRALSVGVIESREDVGKGVAYSAVHPDYRLNGPSAVHIVMPDRPNDFHDWLQREGILEADLEGWAGSGAFFARRADFGRYMAELFQGHQAVNGTGTDLIHIHARAMSLVTGHDFSTITLDKGQQLTARLVVLATSNEMPAVPKTFQGDNRLPSGFIPNPWDLDRLAALALDAPILVLGTGLTAADVITALASHGHTGPIDAVSRTGLLPMSQNPMPDKETMWERFLQTPPRFIKKHGALTNVSDILRCLRRDIVDRAAEGKTWHGAFDDLRDAVRTLWPDLSLSEQQRFRRHLKSWYETRRFRIAPQVQAVLDDYQMAGSLNTWAARIISARSSAGGEIAVTFLPRAQDGTWEKTYRAVINCTGPNTCPDDSGNPIMEQLALTGAAMSHPTGHGFLVDRECRAISASGEPQKSLRIIGPLTRGTFMESGSVPAISYQIHKIMPDVLAALDAS